MQIFSQLPTNQQLEVKKEISKLLFDGKGYKKIRRHFKEKGIKISLGTLSYWCNTDSKRLLKNSFTPSPSKELAYFIGVMFGDGSATFHKKITITV
jgi:intein-encoded DNA endonuclease-like protein